jgi:hypothetical protein
MRVPGNTAIPELPRADGSRAALLPAAFRTILPMVILFFGLSPFARADDFWKQKPPSQWSHAEALKLVRHSPWAKVEVVVFLRQQNQASYSIPTGTKHCDPDAIDANGNCLQKGRIEAPVDSSRQPNAAPSLSPSTAFLVRWESAEPVNQAFARLEELGEGAGAAASGGSLRYHGETRAARVRWVRSLRGHTGGEPRFACNAQDPPWHRCPA